MERNTYLNCNPVHKHVSVISCSVLQPTKKVTAFPSFVDGKLICLHTCLLMKSKYYNCMEPVQVLLSLQSIIS